MFDSPRELLDAIHLGEDSFLELKEVRFSGKRVSDPRRDDLADELAAFANRRGGTCVLGVDDATREVLGIPEVHLDTVERLVQELCNDSIKPPLVVDIKRLLLPAASGEQLPILRIDVPQSLFVHRSPGGYFHRVGSSKREMPPDYLARLFQQRSQVRLIRFDEQAVPQATLDDLESDLVGRFRTAQTTDDRPTLLRKLGMAREDASGVLRPSVAGLLMGSAHPEKWIPNAYIQAVAYRGTGAPGAGDLSAYQLDAKDIVGSLDIQVAAACRFVARNMRVEASKRLGRQDLPQYDMTAIFEAFVNAVAHRDYAMEASKIRLRMFADRLELYSPGGLPNTMTVDSLAFRQASRNETITSLLARCPVPEQIPGLATSRAMMMDRRGEGVAIILERSEELSSKRPVYELPDDSELRLTIFAAELVPDGAG